MTTAVASPPSSIESEQCVIGSILLEQDAILQVCDKVRPDDFWHAETRAAYQAALNLLRRGDAIDFVSMTAELEKLGESSVDLFACIESTPTATHIKHHANVVQRMATCRRAIQLAGEMGAEFYEAPSSPEEVIGKYGSRLLGLTDRVARRDPDPRSIIQRLMALDNEEGIRLSSPLLNYWTGGLRTGEFWVVGAFSSTGKTALALQWLREALDQGASCAYFSLEMAQEQLMLRLIANYSGVAMRKIRLKQCYEDEWDRVHDAEDKLAGFADRFWLYDDVYSHDEMCYLARKHKLQRGIDVLFVDYLQNLKGGSGDKKHLWLESACNTYLALAKDLGCCVVALSQVTTGEARLKDEEVYSFKDAGAIRDIADKAFVLSRDREGEKDMRVGTLHCALKKNRTWGLIGSVDLSFEFATGRIWQKEE